MRDLPAQFPLLVFDWDGTVMDSTARISSTLAWAGADVGLPELPDQTRRNVIGLGLLEAMRLLYPQASANQHQQLVERYRYHWLKPDAPMTSLFAGAREALATLKECGYWLTVATGKSRAGLDRSMAEAGIADWFVCTRCADETRSKPNPEMLEQILLETGLEASQAIMIGDSVYDLEMAQHAKMASLGVLTGVHDHSLLSECEPRAVLDSIADLPQWLQQGLVD